MRNCIPTNRPSRPVKSLQVASVDLKTHSIAGEEQHTDEHIVGYYNTGDRMKRWGKVGAVRRWWLDRVAGS